MKIRWPHKKDTNSGLIKKGKMLSLLLEGAQGFFICAGKNV